MTQLYGIGRHRRSDAAVFEVLVGYLKRAIKKPSSFELNDKGTLGRAIQDLVEGFPLDSTGLGLFERAAAQRRFVCMRLKLSNRLTNLPIGYIRNMVESALPKSIVFDHHRNSVVAFIDLDELGGKRPYEDEVRVRIERFTKTMGMKAGLSDPERSIVQARLYYLEANIALENGSMLGPDKEPQGESHDHLHLRVGGEARRVLSDDSRGLGAIGKLLALVVDGITHGFLLCHIQHRIVPSLLLI